MSGMKKGVAVERRAIMTARNGKVARLPKVVREELNRRLEDGEQGRELLSWLNGLPATAQLVESEFGGKPINKHNLSDWRRGGYVDWLRWQEREARIREVAEQGGELRARGEGAELSGYFATLTLAELAVDLDAIHDMKEGAERWQRLKELTRETARLQHAFNQCRRQDLAWAKWNFRVANAEHSSAEFAGLRPEASTRQGIRSAESNAEKTDPHLTHGADSLAPAHSALTAFRPSQPGQTPFAASQAAQVSPPAAGAERENVRQPFDSAKSRRVSTAGVIYPETDQQPSFCAEGRVAQTF